nr:hypothetical protein [Lachnospiraceae bacterium]
MNAFLFDVSTERLEDAKAIARTIVRCIMWHDLQEITVKARSSFLVLISAKEGMTQWRRRAFDNAFGVYI